MSVKMIRVDPARLITARRMISVFGFLLAQAMVMVTTLEEGSNRSWNCLFGDRGLSSCSAIKLSGVFLPYCVFCFVYFPDLSVLVEDCVYHEDLAFICFL